MPPHLLPMLTYLPHAASRSCVHAAGPGMPHAPLSLSFVTSSVGTSHCGFFMHTGRSFFYITYANHECETPSSLSRRRSMDMPSLDVDTDSVFNPIGPSSGWRLLSWTLAPTHTNFLLQHPVSHLTHGPRPPLMTTSTASSVLFLRFYFLRQRPRGCL